MNCCFVSFFLGRGKGMNFLPYVSVQCPACSAESFFKVSVESTAFSVFCCRAATASPFPISSFSQGYTGFREWYRCGSLLLPSPYAGTVSPFRSPEYGHAQGFVVTGINVSGWNTRIPSERKNSRKFCRVRRYTVTTDTTLPFSTTTIRILHQNRRDREGHLRHPVPVYKD